MEIQSMALSCDDSYICLLSDVAENFEDNQNLISDAKYAEELQLQEAIMASLIAPHNSGNTSAPDISRLEIGESSEKAPKDVGESSQSMCEICAESKDTDQMFPVQSCSHHFCIECISKHISIKISTIANQENTHIISCPGFDCKGMFEIENCRKIMPEDVLSMWDDVICESMIDPSQKFYCPHKNCSALLVNDGDDQEVIRQAECPFCRRLFCVRCNVPWHSGVECEEFLRLNDNERTRADLMVHELAKQKKWQRCPHCKFFVERNEGCLHMSCRCGYQFCYSCGAAWSSTHGGCQ